MKGWAMNKVKTLVPKLRFPEFQEMAGWKERKIGDFLSESRLPGSKGNVAKKLTVKLWGNGVFGKNEAIQGSINTQYFRRRSGQFIYSKLDFLNQAFGVIPPNLDGFESTVDLPCFDIVDGLDPVFLLEYVKRKDFYERLGETADGSRKARRIHAETFQSFSFALPPPAEQQKIADCLSSLDELIAAQARKVDALKTHKKGLMQQLFPREGETQPRLRFPEFQNAGEWAVKRLDEICKIQRGKFSHRPRNDPKFFGGKYPFIQTGDVVKSNGGSVQASQTLNELGLSVSKLFKPPIVLITIAANIGDTGLLDREACFTDSVVGLIPNSRVSAVFLELLVRGQKEYLNKIAPAAAQKNINNEILSVLVVLIPEFEEQQRIADCLTSLDDLITAATQELETLKSHKKGLMQQLFPSAEAVET
jgi:type I restriction enzyme S subunit